jgi:hypothetical protein
MSIASELGSGSVRLVCTGNRTHRDTMLARCTLHDDSLETTRLYSRHNHQWEKTTIRCRRCTREWQMRDARLEMSVITALRLGVSRVDLSRVA